MIVDYRIAVASEMWNPDSQFGLDNLNDAMTIYVSARAGSGKLMYATQIIQVLKTLKVTYCSIVERNNNICITYKIPKIIKSKFSKKLISARKKALDILYTDLTKQLNGKHIVRTIKPQRLNI